MIRKSHVMIASLLLMVTIVLSGCTIRWPPPPPQIGACDINSAADFYYKNKPTPVVVTGTFYNPIDSGIVNIYVDLQRFDTSILDWVDLGIIFTMEDVSIVTGGSVPFDFKWVYTKGAVATTYSLLCVANHENYPDYTLSLGGYMFTIWNSKSSPTGQAKAAFQAIRNAGSVITKAETLITAYQAGQTEGKILQPCEHVVDLSSLGLETMTADQAIILAQSKLDDASKMYDNANYAFNLHPTGSGVGDYKAASALAKQAKADAQLAKNIAQLTLNQIVGTECDLT